MYTFFFHSFVSFLLDMYDFMTNEAFLYKVQRFSYRLVQCSTADLIQLSMKEAMLVFYLLIENYLIFLCVYFTMICIEPMIIYLFADNDKNHSLNRQFHLNHINTIFMISYCQKDKDCTIVFIIL